MSRPRTRRQGHGQGHVMFKVNVKVKGNVKFMDNVKVIAWTSQGRPWPSNTVNKVNIRIRGKVMVV